MVVRIKLLVSRRTLQPEIRAQINNPATMPKQRDSELSRHAVWQGEENDFRVASEQICIRLGKTKPARGGVSRKSGKDLGNGLAGALPRGHRRQLNAWMVQKQANQFLA